MSAVVMAMVVVAAGVAMMGCCQAGSPPLRPRASGRWENARAAVGRGDAEALAALDVIKAEAEKALQVKPPSVMDKTKVASSGDKHDYISLGPYWWPDPTKKDGLPYIRRDGEVNPESLSTVTDRPAFAKMASSVSTLALAWELTRDERYAQHAATMLRVWFLSPDSRMNPHLNYGQAVPGIVEGRCIGIIDTGILTGVVESLELLESYPGWTAADRTGLRTWLAAYLDWLLKSELGIAEAKEHNNHGTWYDAQVAALAIYVGREDIARRVLEEAKERRIAKHIKPDGSQPHELARTRSLDYSLMNLRGFMTLADYGQRVGVDLWHYQTAEGAGIRKAIDFVAPYADSAKPWPHPQIGPPASFRPAFPQILRQAAQVYGTQYLRYLPADSAKTEAGARALLRYRDRR